MATSESSRQTVKPESGAGLVYGWLVAVLAINVVILAYAISVSKPTEIIVVTQSNPRDPGTGNAVASGGSSESADTTPMLDVDEALLDDDEFDDWETDEPVVVNPIELPDEATVSALFNTQCAVCHGDQGRGDGPASEQLLPRPRDFIGSPFRYATRGGSRNQIIMDLERTIGAGVPRSAMPGFDGVLSDSAIAGLAHHVLKLREESQEAEGFIDERAGDVGMRPPWTSQMVARGQELFGTLACVTCHGETGRGDGINAASLVDMQEKPVRPADLTSGLFKSGQKPQDLVRTIMQGVPGTPMVAYELAVTQENDDGTVNVMDAWALVAYIRSLAETPQPPGQPSGAKIIVEPARDPAMFSDPAHIAWLGIEPTLISVKPLYQREEHTTFVEVRAVQYGDRVALCLDWDDQTINMSTAEGLDPDAVMAMFGLDQQVPPLPLGLDVPVSEGAAQVLVWRWSADAHFRAHAARDWTAEDVQAARQRGWYLLTGNGKPGESYDAGAVEEQIAFGISKPERLSGQSQGVTAAAVWSLRKWRVIMVHTLEADGQRVAPFTMDAPIPISFAVWDGAKGRDKLISGWHWLVWKQ